MLTNTVQSLNNIDGKLFELQITLCKYCLAGTHERMEKAIPRPASIFSDAGKNTKSNVEAQVIFSLIYIKKK